jgi:hypothetical protein
MTRGPKYGPCNCHVNPLRSLLSADAHFAIDPRLIPRPDGARELPIVKEFRCWLSVLTPLSPSNGPPLVCLNGSIMVDSGYDETASRGSIAISARVSRIRPSNA